MLIRSQDKLQLMPLGVDGAYIEAYSKNGRDYYSILETENNEKGNNIVFVVRVNQCWMGEYSTKAKAIKILDMIQGQYGELKNPYNNREGCDIYPVFGMPQDSEVEE